MQPDHTPQEQLPEAAHPQTNSQPINPLAPSSKKKGVLLPILIMVAPIIFIITSVLLYATANFLMGTAQPAAPSDSSMFGVDETPNPAKAIINSLLFLFGAVAVVGILPCFIIGLVLLVHRLQK